MEKETKKSEIATLSSPSSISEIGGDSEHVVHKEEDPEERSRHLILYRAALNGDWDVAKHIYDKYPTDVHASISKRGDTALHIAAAANRIDFVRELVRLLQPEDLRRRNEKGITALSLAAASGMVDLAKVIIKKNREITMIQDANGMLPIHMAASLGHKEMVRLLYDETRDRLHYTDCIELFITLIDNDFYDVAVDLLKHYPELATVRAENEETALHAMARKHLLSSNGKPAGFFRRCFKLANEEHPAVELVECLWKEVIKRLSDSAISDLIAKPWRLLFIAAKQGNFEFLSILIREYPDLIWKVDEDGHSIFHIAVLNRHEDIFKLIYEIGSIKYLVASSTDREGNNILHLAGMLAPLDRLDTVPGAALQLKRELLWFKEVRKVVQSTDAEAKNKYGLTPEALFAKEHGALREKGETWLKDTAAACMLVATLIAIVAFGAAFAVPGGYKRDSGLPFYLEKGSFKLFAVSDAVSLASSATSILLFISIFTSQRPKNDFLRSSTRKLHIGLLTLFFSIAAMMVMFSATFFILFNGGSLWIAILATAIVAMPVILFFKYQYLQIYHDDVLSTYASDSVFQKGKPRLFYKQGEATERRKAKQFTVHFPIACTCSINV